MTTMIRPRLICAALVLVTLLVYLPVAQHGFVAFDDPEYIVNNRAVNIGLSGAGVTWAFTTWHASNWHPLTWLSHMLDCELFGPNAGAHHLMSVLIHAVNAVLFFLLWFRLTRALWPSALLAALFAWHPLHVESVAWASERKDVLSTFFWGLTLWSYTGYAQNRPRPARPALPPFRSRDYSLALLWFALGLMAKPMLVTLPFVLLLLDYWPLKRAANFTGWLKSLFPLALEKSPFFLLTILSCVITYLAQRGEAVVSLAHLPLGMRLVNAIAAYASYLCKMIWPANLAALYPANDHPSGWAIALAGMIIIGISVVVARNGRQRPYLVVGWLWYLGTLVPVIGLVQVGSQAMADRYTYVPLIGIFVMLVFAGQEFISRLGLRPRVVGGVVGGLLLSCLALTFWQLQFWRDSEAVFRRAVEVTGPNAPAQVGWGEALERKGRTEEALSHYREALRIAPWYVDALNNLAGLLATLGKNEEALKYYQAALRYTPNAADLHCNLGITLALLGRIDEALAQYAEAARLAPSHPRAQCLMGKARLTQGRTEEAVNHFRTALRLDAADVETLLALAQVLASAPDPKFRNGSEAVTLATQANTLSVGPTVGGLDVLAMAYAEAGRFDLAQTVMQNAIALASATGRTNDSLADRLRLYQSNQPYRAPAPPTPAP